MNDILSYENVISTMDTNTLRQEFKSVQELRQYAYNLLEKQEYTFLTRKDKQWYSIIIETNKKIDLIINQMQINKLPNKNLSINTKQDE